MNINNNLKSTLVYFGNYYIKKNISTNIVYGRPIVEDISQDAYTDEIEITSCFIFEYIDDKEGFNIGDNLSIKIYTNSDGKINCVMIIYIDEDKKIIDKIDGKKLKQMLIEYNLKK